MDTLYSRPSRHWMARVMIGGAFVLSLGLAAAPVAAQTSSGSGSSNGGSRASRGWQAGPDASGANTYVGHIESVRDGSQTISSRTPAPFGSTVRVTGWAVDTTAQGWAGFDKVAVYQGTADKGKKLADGSVGQTRSDVEEVFGKTDYKNSGFFVDVPLAGLDAGQQSLNLYLHTPDKGWWYRAFSVYQKPSAAAQAVGGQPTVFIVSPSTGDRLDVAEYNRANGPKGFNVKIVALDQNLKVDNTDPNKQCLWTGYATQFGLTSRFGVGTSANPQNCGVDRVQVYVNGDRGDPNAIMFNATAGALQPSPSSSLPKCGKGGYMACPNFNGGDPGGNYAPIAAGFGTQFWGAGWQTSSVNLMDIMANGPSGSVHTAYAYARSHMTGVEHKDSVDFQVIDSNNQ